MSSEKRPLFICGPLCAPPLLAWVLTGDTSNADDITKLMKPARIYGYERYTVKQADHPALIKAQEPTSWVDGYLLHHEMPCQRKKLNDFEGEIFQAIQLPVHLLDKNGELLQQTAEADIYLWAGDRDSLSSEPWNYDEFVKKRMEDWLVLFERVGLDGDDY